MLANEAETESSLLEYAYKSLETIQVHLINDKRTEAISHAQETMRYLDNAINSSKEEVQNERRN